MKAAKTLELYADTAEGFDWHKGLSLSMLAELTHKKKAKALRLLRKFIHKGWLSAWMDEPRRAEAGDGRNAEEDGESDAGRQHGDACVVALFCAGAEIVDGGRHRLLCEKAPRPARHPAGVLSARGCVPGLLSPLLILLDFPA